MICVGIVAHLIFLLYTTDREILSQILTLKFKYLVLIALLVMVPWCGHALRLTLWTRLLGQPLPYIDSLNIAVSTDLGSALTPTMIGGGPIKLGLLLNKGFSPARATFLALLSGFEDFIFYTAGITLTFIFAKDGILKISGAISGWISANVIATVFIAILILLILWYYQREFKKVNNRLLSKLPNRIETSLRSLPTKLKDNLNELKGIVRFIFKEGKLTFLASLSILFIQWAAKFSVLAVILLALDVDCTWYLIYLKQWLVWLTMIFIPTPGASGGAEASFYLIFGNAIDSEVLALVVSVWRFFTYYFVLFSAVVFYQVLRFFGK